MTLVRIAFLVPLVMTLGCQFTQDLGGPTRDAIAQGGSGGGGGAADGSAHHAALPLEDLEYPMGLWIRDGKVYFTEAAGTGTSGGGAIRLSVYDLATSTRTTLVENPINHDAVAVASDGKIYLGGWSQTFPGQHGHISVVDPATLIESPVVDIPAAVTDLFMDDEDNLYVSANGDIGYMYENTTAIYRLAAGDYTHPRRYRKLPADTFTASGDDLYLVNWGISRVAAGGPMEKDWVPEDPSYFATRGLTVHSGTLFYGGSGCSDGIVPGHGACPPSPIGSIRRVALSTGGAFTTVATGLTEVANVRADRATGKLYVLEFGTGSNGYLDGRLSEIDPTP